MADVTIAFSERDHRISEFSQKVLMEVTKDLPIASSVTVNIIPRTIDEVTNSGGTLPVSVSFDRASKL